MRGFNRLRRLIVPACAAILFIACHKSEREKTVYHDAQPPGQTSGQESDPTSSPISYQDAFPGATFTRPVFLAEVPDKPETFLALEQPGRIQIISKQGAGWSKTEFAEVDVSGGRWGGDERGLLGFAFHPDYAANKKYYVYYVKGSANVLSEGIADSTLVKDSGAPLRVLISIPDPFPNHNGGTIAFGPKDGFLYIGTGDGGSAGDPYRNGQNKRTLLGKFLRIDVNSRPGGKPYAIPPDNPFVDGSGAPEIWAYGLRNPWKWSFDPVTGDLWAGDVGQDRIEEVSIIEKGGNYGWNKWEGDQCYPPGTTACDVPAYKPPLFTYKHDEHGGISITGGVVYRGNPSSPYYGDFIFGDYGSGNVWALGKSGQATPLPKPPGLSISSFSQDSRGRVYIMGVNSDIVYRMQDL